MMTWRRSTNPALILFFCVNVSHAERDLFSKIGPSESGITVEARPTKAMAVYGPGAPVSLTGMIGNPHNVGFDAVLSVQVVTFDETIVLNESHPLRIGQEESVPFRFDWDGFKQDHYDIRLTLRHGERVIAEGRSAFAAVLDHHESVYDQRTTLRGQSVGPAAAAGDPS